MQGQVRTQNIREVAITPVKTIKNMVSREASATPALTLLNEDPSFEAGIGCTTDPESSSRVVLFRGTVGVTDGGATVPDGVADGSREGVGERVCFQAGYTISWSTSCGFIS